VDLDPQGNSTTGLGIRKPELPGTTYDVLLGRREAPELIQQTAFPGLHLLPTDQNLVAANLDLVEADNRERRLRTALEALRTTYRFILIDCPPALDLLTLNAMVAADSVLVPIQCEFFALEGVSQLMDTIQRVKKSFDHDLQIEGILLTMYDDRTNLTRQVAEDLREFFDEQVFQTIIPRSVKLAEAPSFGQTVLAYDPKSKGAESYVRLAKEILQREQAARHSQGAR
jgi:chromosome partitioning protein